MHGATSESLAGLAGGILIISVILGLGVSAVSLAFSRRSRPLLGLLLGPSVTIVVGALVAQRDPMELGGNAAWRFMMVAGPVARGISRHARLSGVGVDAGAECTAS